MFSRAPTMRRLASPAHAALALVLAGAVAVRLYGIRHGLPFSYHSDEALHFTSRAVAMFEEGLNPHYFQNPSGYTYLVHVALWLSGFDDVTREFRDDPTDIYLTARYVAVALGVLGAVAAYVAGRRLWGTLEGIAAAAIMGFAFLPVAYSRYAVTDAGALPAVAFALYAIVRVHEDGRRRWFVLAGAATGLAIGFKYTTGLIVVPLLAAATTRIRRDRAALRDTALALAAVVAAFLVTTPYFLLDLGEALDELRAQSYAADEPKIGQDAESPLTFYPSSLTWGLGWGGALAALGGLVWLFRRERARALLLAAFPVLLYLYLCTAERHFARWLMPTYPALALLAGFGLARAARSLALRPGRQVVAFAVLLGLVLAQPLLADLRTGALLRRDDTRAQTRAFLRSELPPRARMVIEPAVPLDWYRGFTAGFGPPPRYRASYPPLPARPTRYLYAAGPERIDRYRAAGFCLVVVLGFVRERAEVERPPRTLAYYDRLERESDIAFRAHPYDDESEPVPFDFDRSTHLYYDRGFDRTGPEVVVYRLRRCRQGYGRPTTGDPAAYWN
jgi:hypothetical protein